MTRRTIAARPWREIAHALVAALLCTALGACAARAPGLELVAPVAALPVAGHDATSDYTAVVPRAWIAADELDDDAPDAYTVVRGDTLWDISDRFLKKPWLWPTIWNYNPQVADPHLIYPGDVLALEYVNGRPALVLTRHGKPLPMNVAADAEPRPGAVAGRGVTRLSPRVRVESLADAVPTIPGDAIRPFLVHPRVVDLDTIENAPYVVGNDDGRLISALGHQVYARGALSSERTRYGVFRRNKALRDPLTDELLGYEISHVADARLLRVGDPATLAITSNEMETIAGDILLASGEDDVAHVYTPRLPELRGGEGRIVSLVDTISRSGRDQVVVLNLGTRSGVAIGDVLAIEARGGSLIDPRGRRGHERVTLPDMRTGVVMVFKAFEKVSYALVMESTRPVTADDIVTGI